MARRRMTEGSVEEFFARHAADVERLRNGDASVIDDLLYRWSEYQQEDLF